jgi:hypothetical protein
MDDRASSGKIIPTLEKIVFVYDGGSGEVLETHHFSSTPGGKFPSEARLESELQSDASERLKGDSSEIRLANLPAEDFDPLMSYRFDLNSERLVAAPAQREILPRLGIETGPVTGLRRGD